MAYSSYSPSPSSIEQHRAKLAYMRDWRTTQQQQPSLGSNGSGTGTWGRTMGVGSARWSPTPTDTGTGISEGVPTEIRVDNELREEVKSTLVAGGGDKGGSKVASAAKIADPGVSVSPHPQPKPKRPPLHRTKTNRPPPTPHLAKGPPSPSPTPTPPGLTHSKTLPGLPVSPLLKTPKQLTPYAEREAYLAEALSPPLPEMLEYIESPASRSKNDLQSRNGATMHSRTATNSKAVTSTSKGQPSRPPVLNPTSSQANAKSKSLGSNKSGKTPAPTPTSARPATSAPAIATTTLMPTLAKATLDVTIPTSSLGLTLHPPAPTAPSHRISGPLRRPALTPSSSVDNLTRTREREIGTATNLQARFEPAMYPLPESDSSRTDGEGVLSGLKGTGKGVKKPTLKNPVLQRVKSSDMALKPPKQPQRGSPKTRSLGSQGVTPASAGPKGGVKAHPDTQVEVVQAFTPNEGHIDFITATAPEQSQRGKSGTRSLGSQDASVPHYQHLSPLPSLPEPASKAAPASTSGPERSQTVREVRASAIAEVVSMAQDNHPEVTLSQARATAESVKSVHRPEEVSGPQPQPHSSAGQIHEQGITSRHTQEPLAHQPESAFLTEDEQNNIVSFEVPPGTAGRVRVSLPSKSSDRFRVTFDWFRNPRGKRVSQSEMGETPSDVPPALPPKSPFPGARTQPQPKSRHIVHQHFATSAGGADSPAQRPGLLLPALPYPQPQVHSQPLGQTYPPVHPYFSTPALPQPFPRGFNNPYEQQTYPYSQPHLHSQSRAGRLHSHAPESLDPPSERNSPGGPPIPLPGQMGYGYPTLPQLHASHYGGGARSQYPYAQSRGPNQPATQREYRSPYTYFPGRGRGGGDRGPRPAWWKRVLRPSDRDEGYYFGHEEDNGNAKIWSWRRGIAPGPPRTQRGGYGREQSGLGLFDRLKRIRQPQPQPAGTGTWRGERVDPRALGLSRGHRENGAFGPGLLGLSRDLLSRKRGRDVDLRDSAPREVTGRGLGLSREEEKARNRALKARRRDERERRGVGQQAPGQRKRVDERGREVGLVRRWVERNV